MVGIAFIYFAVTCALLMVKLREHRKVAYRRIQVGTVFFRLQVRPHRQSLLVMLCPQYHDMSQWQCSSWVAYMAFSLQSFCCIVPYNIGRLACPAFANAGASVLQSVHLQLLEMHPDGLLTSILLCCSSGYGLKSCCSSHCVWFSFGWCAKTAVAALSLLLWASCPCRCALISSNCCVRQVTLLLSDAPIAFHVMCQYAVCYLCATVACDTIGYMVAICNSPV